MFTLSNKLRGFTLIELVIAMGILILVFTGTVTLIVMVVNLAMSTRIQTEAVALTQRGLTETITKYRANPNDYDPANLCPTSVNLGNQNNISISCTINNPDVVQAQGDGFDEDNFVNIVIISTWTPKGSTGPISYNLVQAIRKGF